ncbi:unknown protein [Seminavis robusta]|uniref:Uncharacterized protein n=1 Tax=Seminavis robusta TaxID=568900 RepID=A0A9N8HZ86_9STRA|nr:unknown protein [Seminavis robusta]|eukprot:Sro3360_g347210.1 n/a (407) ;mRNA; r:938-2158
MTIKDLLAGLIDVDNPSGKDAKDASNDGDGDDASVLSGLVSDSSKDDEDEAVEDNCVKLSLGGLLDSEGLIQTAKHQIQFDEVDMAQVRAILKELGKNPSAAKDEAKKKKNDLKSFSIFLDAEPRLRRHLFKSKKHLLDIATKLEIGTDAGANQEALRKAIETHLRLHPDAIVEVKLSKKQEKQEQIAMLSAKDQLLLRIVKAGYLDPLEGEAKKHSRRGHQLECHIMRACLRELEEDSSLDSPLKLVAVCTAPLVERKHQCYIRGSIDFLALASVDDIDVVPIGVEIKSRVAAKMYQKVTHQAGDAIRRLLGEDRTPRQRQRKYFSVRADSDKFKRIVNSMHEAIQLLHHAFVYDLDYVLLLVGDNSGAVVYGVMFFVFVPSLNLSRCPMETYWKISTAAPSVDV